MTDRICGHGNSALPLDGCPLSSIADSLAGRPGYTATLEAIRVAFEAAGLEFIPENGGGVGVRFSKPKT